MSGRVLGSWREVGGQNTGWLDSWKKDGSLLVCLHKQPPRTRHVHSFRKTVLSEKGTGVTRQVFWLPFVGWESDAWYREAANAKMDKRPGPAPTICPMAKFLSHLARRDDIADDDLIFRFDATKREDGHDISKGDALQKKGFSFREGMLATFEYLMFVIPVMAEKPSIMLTNEKQLLGRRLHQAIENDCKNMGDEAGDPMQSPIIYEFTYDKGPPVAFGVASKDPRRLKGLSEEKWAAIRELWAAPPPYEELARACRRGSAKELHEAMRHGLEAAGMLDQFPLDDFFAAAFEVEKNEGEGDEGGGEAGESGAEVGREQAAKPVAEKPSRARVKKDAPKVAEPPKVEPPKVEPPKAEPPKAEPPKAEPPKAEPPKAEPPKAEPPKAAPPPPPPPPEDSVPECDQCRKPWPLSEKVCPHCGAEALDEESVEEESQRKMPWQ